MCTQEYGACRNRNCGGIAQTHAFIRCLNSPNCRIKYDKVPKDSHGERFCPDCRELTSKERKRQTTRDWRAARQQKHNAAAAAAAAGGVHAAVEQQGESSTMGESQPLSDREPGSGSGNFVYTDETGTHIMSEEEERKALLESFMNSTRHPRFYEGRDGPSWADIEVPIDPALIHVDRILSSGPNQTVNMELAQQFLADVGLWPESMHYINEGDSDDDKEGGEASDSKKPSDKEGE